ncbi:hypothetical protein [Methylobacterium gnaphalii]|nr:hypothetical protein [Methylobacterium gnaphalii]
MRSRADDELAFACALDKAEPKDRLRAMIARAFARADRHAHACATELDIRARTSKLATALKGSLSALADEDGILWYKNRAGEHLQEGSAIVQALKAYERLGYPGGSAEERRYEVHHGLTVMAQMREAFESFADQEPAYGWPQTGDGQFFFLLRLAEVFAVSTGEVPSFSGYSRKGTHWTDFALATLHLTGLGVSNFDELSRRFGGKRPDRRQSDFEENWPWMFEAMAGWFAPPTSNQRAPGMQHAGNLISNGVANNRQDGDEPLSWRDHEI